MVDKIFKANRSGAKIKILDECEKHVVVEYLTNFTGVYKYPKDAINEHWSLCELDN